MKNIQDLTTVTSDVNTKIEGIVEVLLGQTGRLQKIEELFRTIRTALWVTNALVFVLIIVELLRVGR